jgi:hypothetical protein
MREVLWKVPPEFSLELRNCQVLGHIERELKELLEPVIVGFMVFLLNVVVASLSWVERLKILWGCPSDQLCMGKWNDLVTCAMNLIVRASNISHEVGVREEVFSPEINSLPKLDAEENRWNLHLSRIT